MKSATSICWVMLLNPLAKTIPVCVVFIQILFRTKQAHLMSTLTFHHVIIVYVVLVFYVLQLAMKPFRSGIQTSTVVLPRLFILLVRGQHNTHHQNKLTLLFDLHNQQRYPLQLADRYAHIEIVQPHQNLLQQIYLRNS